MVLPSRRFSFPSCHRILHWCCPSCSRILRGESIGSIESTLACPGTKLEQTAFFSVRRKARRPPRSERQVDWRHRKHSVCRVVPVVHHWHAKLSIKVAYSVVHGQYKCYALRSKSIGDIESTLARPGTKLEYTAFFLVRKEELLFQSADATHTLLLLLSAGCSCSLFLSCFHQSPKF
jgi:hypothetical protein